MRPNFTATIVAVGLCLTAGASLAAGTVEGRQTAVKLYRGTSIIAASDPKSDVYVADFTPAACATLLEQRWQAEAATRTSGSATYKCQVEERVIVSFQPSPTCPALPAPEGRVVSCPAGYTGAYTQTRSYTAAPYPTCATLGEWSPTDPPAGSCTPVTSEWTHCADEWGFCQFSGTRRVRYGANTAWVERDVTAVDGGVQCRNSVFGDPAPGTLKRCELRNVSTEPTHSGVATLSWTPPTQNTDGTSLTNLAGYWIHYGTSPTAMTQTAQLANPGQSGYTIGNLAPGAYYFAVRAYTSGGTESALSNVVSKSVQ